MMDAFGRSVTYLRLSVTDRCDLRCAYCMDETPDFLPKTEVLTLEELERLAGVFIRLGVRRVRLTGGEPLARRNVVSLVHGLGRHVAEESLDEVTLTTNGTQLARHAESLAAAGVRRVNVSLDSLDPERFRQLTRRDSHQRVLDGLDAARRAGLAVKVNTVVLKGGNDHEIPELVGWCGERGFDLTLIEAMPMGEGATEGVSGDGYVPLSDVRRRLAEHWTLVDTPERTGGPARYTRVAETGRRLGFITPMSEHFCAGCNRVRVTCTGQLYLCLGRDNHVDLRAPLREHADDAALEQKIRDAMGLRPRGHRFNEAAAGRAMRVTGG